MKRRTPPGVPLEHAVGTDDVGGEDLLRCSAGLARNPREVDHAVHALGRLLRRPGHGEVAGHHFLARRGVANPAQIVPAQRLRRAAQRRAQHAADLARCARQQQAFRPHPAQPSGETLASTMILANFAASAAT